ncbi:MAG: hypothetical protein AAGC60_02460 [Acidobacteriota bacterium]
MKTATWIRAGILACCLGQALPALADRLPSDQIDQALTDMGFSSNFSIQCELPTDDLMALDKPYGSRIYATADYGIENHMVYEERFRFDQKTDVKAPCRGTVIRIEPSRGWVVLMLPMALVDGQIRFFHTYVFDDVETDLELGDYVTKGQTIGSTQGNGNRFEWRYQTFPPSSSGLAEDTKPWLVNQDYARHPRLPLGAGCGVDCLSTSEPPTYTENYPLLPVTLNAVETPTCQFQINLRVPKESADFAGLQLAVPIEEALSPITGETYYIYERMILDLDERKATPPESDGRVGYFRDFHTQEIEGTVTYSPRFMDRSSTEYELDLCLTHDTAEALDGVPALVYFFRANGSNVVFEDSLDN